jgi:phosphatidylserine/phosphatidylglycerophosphate/cardiolipin synthase-like enzyme
MHHKVIVIDGETVVTGSYNFSKNAETRNNENLLIIKGNREIAEAYLAEFERVTR